MKTLVSCPRISRVPVQWCLCGSLTFPRRSLGIVERFPVGSWTVSVPSSSLRAAVLRHQLPGKARLSDTRLKTRRDMLYEVRAWVDDQRTLFLHGKTFKGRSQRQRRILFATARACVGGQRCLLPRASCPARWVLDADWHLMGLPQHIQNSKDGWQLACDDEAIASVSLRVCHFTSHVPSLDS
mmetsp:Transcript_25167/g.65959  ORF Transcript_25167/g.65959 Transcript_25167/m.65959 type:complete len:183 (+) Transcript_25167:1051-1599(+)